MANDTRPHITTTGRGQIGDPGGGWSVREDAVHHIVGQAAGGVGSANYNAAGTYIPAYGTDGIVVATNTVQNPSPQVNTTGWTTSSGNLTPSRTAGEGVDGDYGYRALVNTHLTTALEGPQSGSTGTTYIPVTPGTTIYPSIYAKNVGWGPHSVVLRIAFRDAGGGLPAGWVDVNSTTPYVLPADNSYVRVIGDPIVVPATSVRMIIRLVNASYTTSPWQGPQRNRIGNPDTVSGGTGFAVGGGTGSYVGGKHQLTATGGVGAYVYAGVPTGEGVAGRFTVASGDGFAVRVAATNPNAFTVYARVQANWYVSGGGAAVPSSTQGPIISISAGATVAVELTGIVPTATSGGAIVGALTLLIPYSSSGGANPAAGALIDTTDWAFYSGSNATVLDPASAVPYFSGGTIVTGRTTAWAGTANQSPSTATGDVITIDQSSNVTGDYFDGGTTGETGINYRWTGTEYLSSSEKVELYELTTPVTSFSKFLVNNASVFSHQENDGTIDYGKVAGRITAASPSGASVSISQSTYLQRFVADREIPAVSSGTAFGALDLASQLVSPIWGCTLPYSGGFWSLMGHDAGFTTGNVPVRPHDASIATITPQSATILGIEYQTRLVDSANVYQWTDKIDGAAPGTDEPIYAKGILGSSPYPEVGVAHLAMFVNLDGNARVEIEAGPNVLPSGTGMTANIQVDRTAQTVAIAGEYNPGGVITPFSYSSSISALNTNQPLQIAVAYGWTDSTHWIIKAWVVNGDGFTVSGTPVTVTTGSMGSNLDSYAEPLDIGGTGTGVGAGTRYLYQDRLSSSILTDSTVTTNYLVPYVSADTAFSYESHAPGDYDGGSEPIAGYEGNVWDYLNMVLSVFGRTLRVDYTDGLGVLCDLNHTSDEDIEFNNAEQQPSLAVSADGIGQNIDYILYSTESIVDDIIYDAFETGEVWSVNAGEIKDIRITTGNTVTVVRNPYPAGAGGLFPYGTDYDTFAPIYGAYMISAADNLPVNQWEWISFGGQVFVTEVGVGYINLRLVGPPDGIPGVEGPFSLAVSDGQNTYPRLTLVGSGVKTATETVRRGTGADPEYTSIELATTINNPAISSYARLYTSHFWASKIAAGTKIVLTGTLPREQWDDARFGLFQGSTFVYEDARWRVISGTVTELGYNFTAMNFTTMADFEARWSTETMNDFEIHWDGWQMKDLHIAPLR